MSNSNTPMLASESEYTEQGVTHVAISNTNPSLPHLHQNRNSLHGPVVILWDIENCRVPSDVRPEDVAGNIRMALRVHPVIDGAVTMFSAYGDFNAFPRRLREGCQRTGVKLIDVPNGRKDAADKAILVDMFLFALDNPPPSSIMLISGDVDFSPALHILGQRGYTIILVIPSGVGVSSALSNASKFVWDWPSVARGEGFVPPKKTLVNPRAKVTGFLMGCRINDSVDGQNEKESIVYQGISKSGYNSRNFSVTPKSLSEYCSSSVPTTSKSSSLPNGLNDVSIGTLTSYDQNDLTWVQPGDLNGLKGQLVKLLELAGGGSPLTRLPLEYQKVYGRPLYVSEYGAIKLVSLLKKMADVIAIEGKGQKKFVCLRNSKCGPFGIRPLILARRDNKNGKEVQEDKSNGVMAGGLSSDEFSDDESVVPGENDDTMELEKSIQPGELTLPQFMSLHPPRFEGIESREQAEEWIERMEQIFLSAACAQTAWVRLAEFQLSKKASLWWRNTVMELRARNQAIDWEVFKEKFLSIYFSVAARQMNEEEFTSLRQGNLNVAEYTRRYSSLMRYVPHIAANTNAKVRSYIRGLNPELFEKVVPPNPMTFEEAMTRAELAEVGMNAFRAVRQFQNATPDNLRPKGEQFKTKGGSFFRYRSRRARGQAGRGQSQSQTSNTGSLQCFNCGGPHMIRNCPNTESITSIPSFTCYVCGGPNHIARNCPNKRGVQENGKSPEQPTQSPQARVFALNKDQAEATPDNVIAGGVQEKGKSPEQPTQSPQARVFALNKDQAEATPDNVIAEPSQGTENQS